MSYQPNRHIRSILPIPYQARHGLTTYDAKDPDTPFSPISEVRPPEGAPNVLIILLDDIGFGGTGDVGDSGPRTVSAQSAANATDDSVLGQVLNSSVGRSVLRTAAVAVTGTLVRGIMGALMGGKKTTRRR